MMDRSKVKMGTENTGYLNEGEPGGPDWVPAECDVSIRKGWFWHPEESPKSLAELLNIYFKSVGRNGILLLNVPPNREGRIDRADEERLLEFRSAIDVIFEKDLAFIRPATASQVRGGSQDFGPGRAVDGDPATFWAVEDSAREAWIEISLDQEAGFNVFRIEEPVALGQRIASYRIEIPDGPGWMTIAKGTTVGRKKLDRFPEVRADRIRLVIEKSQACPILSEIGVHFSPFQF
jgi:alpha-L-fucosidase